MDRAIVYTGALPQTVDLLNTGKMGMVGLGFALRAILGDNTVVHGLACAPTTPATLNVTINVGSVYALDNVDATAYSDLGVDQHTTIKQGILYDPVTLAITPPGTPGFSQVYLVQASLLDVDGGLAVIPYLNASNSSQPFSGPANSGTSQYTTRTVKTNISLKAGVAAPTGSQTTPSADSGYVGLYAITVANGQVTITSPNIITLLTAPFFPNLPSIPGDVQNNLWTYANDTGTVNAMVATILPPPLSLTPGMGVLIRAAFGNTSTATFNLNGLGVQPVHRANGANLSSGDYSTGQIMALMWDGSAWQILNFFGFTATTTNNNNFVLNIPYAVDSGTLNALVGVFSPVIAAYAAGVTVEVQVANTITGAATLAANALAAKNIVRNNLPLQARDLLAGQVGTFIYDGVAWQLINARYPFYTFDESAPPASDVFLAIGDQLNISFTGALAVALHVASVPGVYNIEFICTASNSLNTDVALKPNNTIYNPGSQSTFDAYFIGAQDGTNQTSPPWLSPHPGQYQYAYGFPGMFGFDLFDNENASDVINDRGPFFLQLMCCTTTTAKMVRYFSGIKGGAAHGWSIWNDTSTAWTSLGTIVVAAGGGGTHGGSSGVIQPALVSGMAIVTRLA